MIIERLSSLSKLALTLHPTNCSSSESPLLLYSSVIEEDTWHLSLIGPTIPVDRAAHRETWWEGKWQLQNLIPSKSSDELIRHIRSSFFNDDITLKGYREGNEAEIRVSAFQLHTSMDWQTESLSENGARTASGRWRYSTSGVLIIPLARLDLDNQRPLLNLLSITCEVYLQSNNRKQQKETGKEQSDNYAGRDINSTIIPSRSSQMSTLTDSRAASNNLQKATSISSQGELSRSLANPSKKARPIVATGFLDSDDSD
ncbi:hypothetical protein PSHT_11899 [Puccinia striiformis]|uniref:Uncharacterized protein n=1 Tax=Puccinia striiformis TaxID=27350 RepID=A0A2S4V057_9BASI|nr:hypothetical protein PSHT_11899 [Puccinia striiformis]